MSRFTEKEYADYLKSKGLPVELAQGGQQVITTRGESKYKNKPVLDQHGKQLYASRKEARRGAVLELWESQGLISGLVKQPKYPFKRSSTIPETLVYDSGRIPTYVADFEYRDSAGELIVEDVKGVRTSVYKLKKALMWAYYRINVVEI